MGEVRRRTLAGQIGAAAQRTARGVSQGAGGAVEQARLAQAARSGGVAAARAPGPTWFTGTLHVVHDGSLITAEWTAGLGSMVVDGTLVPAAATAANLWSGVATVVVEGPPGEMWGMTIGGPPWHDTKPGDGADQVTTHGYGQGHGAMPWAGLLVPSGGLACGISTTAAGPWTVEVMVLGWQIGPM